MSCNNPGPEYVPMVMVNGQPRPMPQGGKLPVGLITFPPWAFQVKSTSIRDSTELGRRLLTADSAEAAKGLLGISSSGTSPNVWVNSAGSLETTSGVVLDLPKTREFVNFDYDALVAVALGTTP